MMAVLDHTIVPARDCQESVEFYTAIVGFLDLGEMRPFWAVKVNDEFILAFRDPDDFRSIHYAFAMEPQEFETAFANIRASGFPYWDSPAQQENMKGLEMSQGAKGLGKAVYFKDPSGHVLEIKPYYEPGGFSS